MKGLDISREYHKSIIRPVIEEHLPQIKDCYAAALIGWGSDVLGNDDELSQDHEWGPRCLLFLPDSLAEQSSDVWNMLNAKIPPVLMDYPTRFALRDGQCFREPSGDGSGDVNIEVTTCRRYFSEMLGVVMPSDDTEWLCLPENRLLELTGGEVFADGTGELTALREYYQSYYPLNVWKYRLAYAWQSLGWGIDLIGICGLRGDFLSTRNCLGDTLFKVMKLTFLLNRKYSPSYPKWLGREFYKLPHLSDQIGPILESCYLDPDVQSVVVKLESVCKSLIEYQNGCDGLPAIDQLPSRTARGFWKIDLDQVAACISESITGRLTNISLVGAIDQWVTNEDLMLDSSKLKRLAVIYEHEE